MRALYASDEDYAAVNLPQTGICALTNAHMHPWDIEAGRTKKERKQIEKDCKRTLKALLRAQGELLYMDAWLECVDHIDG